MKNPQHLHISGLDVHLATHPQVWAPLSATEMLSYLVDHDFLNALDHSHVLDFGTGSGVVGIVCGLMGAAHLTLSDYCGIAVEVAETNARLNGLQQVQGIQSDRFTQIPPGPYDLIISNPPVQPWLFTDLDHPDTRSQAAAWNEAGADGRLVLDALLKQAQAFLAPGGKLITSASSRHGHRQTTQLLDELWPARWQQIYAAEHAIMPEYHGPYIKIWKHLQALDGDLRIYQIDDRDRRFAQQLDAQGNPVLITTLDLDTPDRPVVLRPLETGGWSVSSPRGEPLGQLAATDPRLPGPPVNEHWYYWYYLLEAIAP